MHLDARGAVTGWGALRLAGATYFDGKPFGGPFLPVPLALGHRSGRRARPHVKLSYEPLDASDIEVTQGVPVTIPLRALFDELRRPGEWREAVVAMDMAAAAELVSVRQMRRYHSEREKWRRASRLPRILELASEQSRSPGETRLRLIWVCDAQLSAPLVNQELYDLDGRLICIPDLFDVDAGLVVEYDGAEHRRARRHSSDVAREEACRRVGLEYCKVTGPDMHSTARVVDRILSTRSRARFLEPTERQWSVVPPPGRATEETLDAKLERRAWIEQQMRIRRASQRSS